MNEVVSGRACLGVPRTNTHDSCSFGDARGLPVKDVLQVGVIIPNKLLAVYNSVYYRSVINFEPDLVYTPVLLQLRHSDVVFLLGRLRRDFVNFSLNFPSKF